MELVLGLGWTPNGTVGNLSNKELIEVILEFSYSKPSEGGAENPRRWRYESWSGLISEMVIFYEGVESIEGRVLDCPVFIKTWGRHVKFGPRAGEINFRPFF